MISPNINSSLIGKRNYVPRSLYIRLDCKAETLYNELVPHNNDLEKPFMMMKMVEDIRLVSITLYGFHNNNPTSNFVSLSTIEQ